MSHDEQAEWLVPTTGAKTLPAVEILTGRGFVTGKSGSGKSNTGGVIAEELLDNNYNLLVVDPEGEYYGLKESYEILHVGNDDLCDVQVTPDHAEQLAEIALERNMPIILDVSDYLDGDEAAELIANVVRELFQKEKDVRKPFLLMIEEMQEYLPQQGGNGELSELLERVAKRGRKRGLGMLGMSQRPSSVDKDFITQCDWMVWHRLTWQNDIDVVRKVLGSELADEVEDLDTGEGFLMTDWDESVERVKFKRKRTHDAGATPGLESYERPDLKSVSQELVQEIQGGTVADAPNADGAGGLDELDQAELNDAVETVEAEGDAITEAQGVVPDSPPPDQGADDAAGSPPAESSTDQQSLMNQPSDGDTEENGDDGTADRPDASVDGPVDDAVSRDDIETAEVDTASDADLASMDESELRDHAKSLERRNQILEDEVSELRSVLQSVESPGSEGSAPTTQTAPAKQSAPTGQPARTQQAQTQQGRSQRGGGRQPNRADQGLPTTQGSTGGPKSGPPTVSKPVPPEPPEERSGVAGNVLEFVAMLGYVSRSIAYRVQLLAYRDDGEENVGTNYNDSR